MCISPLRRDRKLYLCSSPTSCFSNLWSSSVASAPLRDVLRAPLSQSGIGIFRSLGRSNSTCLCQHHSTADWTGGRGKNTLTQAINYTNSSSQASRQKNDLQSRSRIQCCGRSTCRNFHQTQSWSGSTLALLLLSACLLQRTCLHSQETG